MTVMENIKVIMIKKITVLLMVLMARSHAVDAEDTDDAN